MQYTADSAARLSNGERTQDRAYRQYQMQLPEFPQDLLRSNKSPALFTLQTGFYNIPCTDGKQERKKRWRQAEMSNCLNYPFAHPLLHSPFPVGFVYRRKECLNSKSLSPLIFSNVQNIKRKFSLNTLFLSINKTKTNIVCAFIHFAALNSRRSQNSPNILCTVRS